MPSPEFQFGIDLVKLVSCHEHMFLLCLIDENIIWFCKFTAEIKFLR